MVREVLYYENAAGDCPVQVFLDELDRKTKAKVFSVFEIIQNQPFVPTKWLKKMTGTDDIWEIRIEWQSNIFRFLGFMDKGSLIILTNGFQKKTNATPKREIALAEKYKKEYLRRVSKP